MSDDVSETWTTQEQGGELKVYFPVKGVIVPTWLAVVFGSALILSTLAFLLSLSLLADFRADARRERQEDISRFTSEVRLLQLHTQDLENTLIRLGAAKRSDFAPWPQILEGEQAEEARPPEQEE
jgi:hypothetical protein